MNPKVDFYFTKELKWQQEITNMRAIALSCKLTEELKWGTPCYTFQENNIVLIHTFKEYCAFLFFKGALLMDTNYILIQQTKNIQATRQIRFANLAQVTELEDIIKAYIFEAIELEKAGLKVTLKKTTEYEISEEFQLKLNESAELKNAFEALTPGRQRGYLLHFAQPKQAKTREVRIEKCIPSIFEGKGLND
jgi:uncharacterized protein YdeI (YjbR/CyaY-like superfamily)